MAGPFMSGFQQVLVGESFGLGNKGPAERHPGGDSADGGQGVFVHRVHQVDLTRQTLTVAENIL